MIIIKYNNNNYIQNHHKMTSYMSYINICYKNCTKLLETYDKVILINKLNMSCTIFMDDHITKIPNIKINPVPSIDKCSFVMENECIQLYIRGYYLDDIKKICDMFAIND